MIAYVSIGNSDDKLSQQEWADFVVRVDGSLRHFSGGQVHGRWLSEPASQWQNACWCVEYSQNRAWELSERLVAQKEQLASFARMFRQDSIAWAEVKDTEFLGGPVNA